jgi:hypothetical protein
MLFRTCLFTLALLTLACSGAQTRKAKSADVQAQLEEVKALEAEVFPEGINAGTDTTRGWPFVRAAESFADAHQKNEASPGLLMKAAGVANGTNWSNKSIQLWGYMWRRYPDHPRAPEALFYQGFVIDTKFKDYPLATRYYKHFLNSYPNHELAVQVRELFKVAEQGGKLPPVPSAPQN